MKYILVFYCWSRSSLEDPEKILVRSECHFSYFNVGLDRLYKIRKKYRFVPNEIKQNSNCTSANIKIFFLVQYSNDIWKNHILTVLITLLKKKYLLLYNKRVIAWILVNSVPRSVSYCARTLAQYDILLVKIFTTIHAITLYYSTLNVMSTYFTFCKGQ